MVTSATAPTIRMYPKKQQFLFYSRRPGTHIPKALAVGTITQGQETSYLTVPIQVVDQLYPDMYRFNNDRSFTLTDLTHGSIPSLRR